METIGYILVRFWFVFGYTLVCFWFSFGSISVIEMAVSVERKKRHILTDGSLSSLLIFTLFSMSKILWLCLKVDWIDGRARQSSSSSVSPQRSRSLSSIVMDE